MIDHQTVERIKNAANIVEVVSEFVTLRKSGANYKGLCPFHNEKTPSFMVSPARNTCHCFGCGKGGAPISFIMEHEQMTYPEALRWLANKYHIEIQERELTDEEKREQSERESMFIINEYALKYFEDTLHNHPDGVAIGMQYFRQRGIRDDIIKKFQLGFDLPNALAFGRAALQKGYKEEFITKVGICYKNDRGELIDRYAGRVIFPWIGVSGKVVGFGGRVLDSRTKGVSQKYVNTPDTPVYHKDHELYGLFQAKKAIAKEDCVYMVEGYTDVLSMHQCGIENVVANSGTALNLHQIRLLHRFTQNVVLLYDGDEAGIHAAMRGTDMFLAEGMNIKVLLLPDNDDPDSFARKHTATAFREYITTHQTDFMEFKTRVLLNDNSDPIKRAEAISSIVKSISVIPDQIKRAEYIKQCSTNIGTPERTLINEMNKFIWREREEKYKEAEREAARQPQNKPIERPTTNKLVEDVERMLTQEVVRHGEEVIFRDVQLNEGEKSADITAAEYVYYDLSADQLRFQNPIYNRILEEAVAHIHDDGFKADEYFRSHPDQQVNQVATELSTETYILARSNQMRQEDDSLQSRVLHLLLDYRMIYVKNRLGELKQLLPKTPENERAALQQEWMKLLAIRQEIARRVGHSIIVS